MRFFILLATLFSIQGIGSPSTVDRDPASSPAGRPSKIFPTTNPVNAAKNPAISVHGLVLGRVGKPGTNLATGAAALNGAQLQDVTVQFSGTYDTIFSGHVALGDLSAGTVNIREAYGKTISIPVISFKMGQFLANFGKNNLVYPHAQAMVDAPLINQEIFKTGFRSVGVEAELLIPTPWYFNISVAVLNARLSALYASPSDNTVAPVFRMEHDFDFTPETSFGFGGSFTFGDNASGETATTAGADLTLKYQASPTGFGFAWYNEFIHNNNKTAGGGSNVTYGLYSMPLFRFTPAFWAGLRMDLLHREVTNVNITQENVVLAWVASDTSTLRLQTGVRQTTGLDGNWFLGLQYNMTLGSHPGHPY